LDAQFAVILDFVPETFGKIQIKEQNTWNKNKITQNMLPPNTALDPWMDNELLFLDFLDLEILDLFDFGFFPFG